MGPPPTRKSGIAKWDLRFPSPFRWFCPGRVRRDRWLGGDLTCFFGSGKCRIFFKLSQRLVHNFYNGGFLAAYPLPAAAAALKDKLLAMGCAFPAGVISSVEAYLQRDSALCQYVRENETAINAAQREVDEMAYELLAQEQPMAIDLRFILAVIKINGDLERWATSR